MFDEHLSVKKVKDTVTISGDRYPTPVKVKIGDIVEFHGSSAYNKDFEYGKITEISEPTAKGVFSITLHTIEDGELTFTNHWKNIIDFNLSYRRFNLKSSIGRIDEETFSKRVKESQIQKELKIKEEEKFKGDSPLISEKRLGYGFSLHSEEEQIDYKFAQDNKIPYSFPTKFVDTINHFENKTVKVKQCWKEGKRVFIVSVGTMKQKQQMSGHEDIPLQNETVIAEIPEEIIP